jgi:sulfiredoxin
MLKRETFPVANIYVPTARRKTLDSKRVATEGQQTPILVRVDGARFVLVEGLHRLEAAKALGEASIVGYRVDARKH